jgi:hypothetical protein
LILLKNLTKVVANLLIFRTDEIVGFRTNCTATPGWGASRGLPSLRALTSAFDLAVHAVNLGEDVFRFGLHL